MGKINFAMMYIHSDSLIIIIIIIIQLVFNSKIQYNMQRMENALLLVFYHILPKLSYLV
jgi:hypothetical protein